MDEAVDIADEFLSDDKLVVYTEGLNVKRREYRCKRPGLFETGELAVLVDELSASASEVLMPIQCEYFAMEGLTQMIDVIRQVMSGKNARLQFGGIVLTMYDSRNNLSNQVVAAEYRTALPEEKMLEEEIKKRDAMLELLLQKQSTQAPQTQVEEEDFPDEEYASGGHVKKIAKKALKPLEQKILDLEKKIAQQEQEKQVSSLRDKYFDFDDIVNIDTLELLEKNEPDLAQVIGEIKDPYKMGLQSYKYIKALGLAEQVPNARRTKEVVKRIEKNEKSVQSPLAYDKRPMAQAMRLTEADKKALYEEMMTCAGRG